MTWLKCKHCEQLSMMLLGTEEWCYQCGYSNDLLHPLRPPSKEDMKNASIARFQNIKIPGFSGTPEYQRQLRQALKEATY